MTKLCLADVRNFSWISIYSSRPITPNVLHQIVRAWVRTAFSKASSESRHRALEHLHADDLQWQAREINLAQWEIFPNGTANPDSAVFKILPDYLAAELSKPGMGFDFGVRALHFRRCSPAPGGNGTELVSWPPLLMHENGNRWAWSVVLTITAQTVPFQPFPVVYCDLGVRRWISEPIRYISDKKETNVGILTEKPLLQGVHHSESFQVASLCWNAAAKCYDWSDNLIALLNHLHIERFPVAHDIIASPVAAMDLGGKKHSAIYFRYGINPVHPVGAGFWPGDRHPFAQQLAEKLGPELIFTETLKKKAYRIVKPTNPFSEKTKKETNAEHRQYNAELYQQRRQLVNRAVGQRLTIEIWYQSSTIREALLQALRYFLGVTIPDNIEQELTVSSAEVSLTIKVRNLGAIGQALDIDSNIERKKDRVRKAVQQRIQEIRTQITTTEECAGVLIGLQDRDEYDNAEEDPKQAIRLGVAHTGRLSQFITPKASGELANEVKHRAQAAVLDVLRQCGVQRYEPRIEIKTPVLPTRLQYVGIWLITQNKPRHILPVLVYMNSYSTDIRAIAQGFSGWMSYPQALLAIAQGQAKGVKNPRDALPFIKKCLKEVTRQGDTLLLCRVQNLGKAWNWLYNTNLSIDTLSFGNEPPQPITAWKGLRVVRIRDHERNQTPQWYIEKEKPGFGKWLCQINERVFASTYNKPQQFKNFSPSLSRVSASTGQKGKDYDPAPSALTGMGFYFLTGFTGFTG